MINYADYDFYKNYYQGALSFDLFNSYIPKASREIDKVVNKETLEENDINNQVKFVACQMVDYLQQTKTSDNVSTIIIDGVHKTFNQKTRLEKTQEKNDILNGLPLELIRCV